MTTPLRMCFAVCCEEPTNTRIAEPTSKSCRDARFYWRPLTAKRAATFAGVTALVPCCCCLETARNLITSPRPRPTGKTCSAALNKNRLCARGEGTHKRLTETANL